MSWIESELKNKKDFSPKPIIQSFNWVQSLEIIKKTFFFLIDIDQAFCISRKISIDKQNDDIDDLSTIYCEYFFQIFHSKQIWFPNGQNFVFELYQLQQQPKMVNYPTRFNNDDDDDFFRK